MGYCPYCLEYISFDEQCDNKYCKILKQVIKKIGVKRLINIIKIYSLSH